MAERHKIKKGRQIMIIMIILTDSVHFNTHTYNLSYTIIFAVPPGEMEILILLLTNKYLSTKNKLLLTL